MKLCVWLVLCALACPAFGAARYADADLQESKTQMIVPMRSGAFVVFTTETVPAGAPEAPPGFIESEDKPNLIHRVFVDKEGELFFGYELLVEQVASSRQFRVSVRPLSPEYEKELRARGALSNRRLHPGYNTAAFHARPQLVGDGDQLALDVLHNPRTGTKIVDIITVTLEDPRLRAATSSAEAPRDFTPADVQLRVSNYKLLVNGEAVWRSTSGCAGALVWFSLADRGRFIFSLVPRPGYDFRKVGKVEHDRISFEWGGERYEWVSGQTVVTGGGNWNLWVLHDPDYSAGIFDQTPPPGLTTTKHPSFEEKLRRARQTKTQGEFDANTANAPGRKPAPARRMRVAIGAADGAESLLPKSQAPPK